MARSLTVFGQTFQGLVDKCYVLFIYIQAQKTKASSCASTNTVQKLQRLTYQIVVGLVILATEEVLQLSSPQVRGAKAEKRGKRYSSCHFDSLSKIGNYTERCHVGEHGRVSVPPTPTTMISPWTWCTAMALNNATCFPRCQYVVDSYHLFESSFLHSLLTPFLTPAHPSFHQVLSSEASDISKGSGFV